MYPRLGPSPHGEKWSVQARLLDEDVSPQLLQALVSPRGEGHGGGARLAGCPRSGCARWVSLLADPDVCGAHSALQEPSLGALARVITAGACRDARCTRGTGEVGMDADQVRTWEGWHPHRALTLIGVWCVSEDTHRGRQWTPALTLPHGRSGVRVLLMAMCCARSPSPRSVATCSTPAGATRGPAFPLMLPLTMDHQGSDGETSRRATGQGAHKPLDPQRPAQRGPRMAPAATRCRAPRAWHGDRRTGGGEPRVSLWQAMGCRRTS